MRAARRAGGLLGLSCALGGLVGCGSGPEGPASAPMSAALSAAPSAALSAAPSAPLPSAGAPPEIDVRPPDAPPAARPPDLRGVRLPGPGGPLAAASGPSGGAPDGAACRAAADCASGICEGEGCDGQGPVCRPARRLCTKDLRAYCGCDQATFFASGTCPGRPYQARGPCAAEGGARDARTPCQDGKDCPSGICEGQGCDGQGPTCRPPGTMCTMDLVPYCGCNQVTFHSSGTCAGRPYAAKGPCPAPGALD